MQYPRIGIMTFYAVQNYGAALQAFALQQLLKNGGAQSELIRFYDKHNEKPAQNNSIAYRLQVVFHNFIKDPSGFIDSYIHRSRTRKIRETQKGKARAFTSFREQHFNLSQEAYTDYESLKQSNSVYDGFVSGSDMVWTPIGQNLQAYFLQFADQGKRFSFSPSMTGCASYSKEVRQSIRTYLQGIDLISCREKEGVDYVKQETGREALLTIDPTLLLSKEDWCRELSIKISKPTKPYILCYMFGGLPNPIKKEVYRQAKAKGLDVRFVAMAKEEILSELKYNNQPFYGPKEFVELFLNASFVVTNTFHGFLFSLISENPFVVIHREKGNAWKANESRISNLMDALGIADKYLEWEQSISDKYFDMDYSPIQEKVKDMRRISLDYISSIVEISSKNIHK